MKETTSLHSHSSVTFKSMGMAKIYFINKRLKSVPQAKTFFWKTMVGMFLTVSSGENSRSCCIRFSSWVTCVSTEATLFQRRSLCVWRVSTAQWKEEHSTQTNTHILYVSSWTPRGFFLYHCRWSGHTLAHNTQTNTNISPVFVCCDPSVEKKTKQWNNFFLTESNINHLPPSVSLRPNRSEQEDHCVSDDWCDRPRQLRVRHTGGGRHARGVRLGNVLQTNTHPSRAAEGRPQWTLWVSDNTLITVYQFILPHKI